jgi:hypothetical protein
MCGPAILRDSRDIKNSLFPFRPVIVRKSPECQIASADIAIAFRTKEWSILARNPLEIKHDQMFGKQCKPMTLAVLNAPLSGIRRGRHARQTQVSPLPGLAGELAVCQEAPLPQATRAQRRS